MWKCRQCGEIAQTDFSQCRSCGEPRGAQRVRRFTSSAGMPTQRLVRTVQRDICAKCGSAKMIPRVRVLDRGQGSPGEATLEVQRDPMALFFKEGVVSKMSAWVCGDCGYTELYASEPDALWQAYQQVR
jgi:ribosomal protein L37E